MNGAVDEKQDGTMEWQVLEIKSFLRACSTFLPTSGDEQWEAK